MSNLVLSRRKKEGIIIHIPELGETVCEITITNLGPKQVKLAFNANKHIKIDRKEIYNTE
jgi:carbon storage regulator CsrA